ncbi:DUF935 domain-containing protein [Nitratireductor sp. B36]|uniref:DUF935 domain-containing protein n=1 Tax=Nitratireductor sp. B36 TaxID=2762059 RepID=UPI001E372485|nr:DUF935 domain-containing protein [Nitratireductor sp. B36]MCC5780764.1 DUF935 domain-containing protein [Nitratireductor sp. B36]
MASPPRIIDQWGNPVSTRNLKEEVAAPTMGSVRSVWSETIIAGLDPAGMASVLNQAGRGWPDRFFTLADEMEERDLHYRSVLGTRKLAITGVEPIVVAGGDDAQSKKIAQAVKELIEQPAFPDDYTADLLDGLGKGYSVVETIWDRAGKEWSPIRYEWRDQRHFLIDEIDGRTLRLKHPDHYRGLELPPYQFSIHRPKLKSGLPIRGGLARLVAWAFLFKHYSLKDWMAFLEVYGMPLRVGKFGRGASMDDRRVLLQAVRDISTDAAAIIPKEMDIEFVAVSGSSGNNLFSAMTDYLDKQISKGVLGQTMSTDDGSSRAQAEVHENVRHDIARADARQTCVTMNRDLIRPYVDLNYGPQDRYPVVVIPITENEDIKTLADVIDRLVPLGLEVGANGMRERLGFEAPEKGEKLLHPAAAGAPGKEPPEKPEEATARQQTPCAHCGGYHALAEDERDELDLLIEDALNHWQMDLDPLLKPLRSLIEEAGNYDELREGLDTLMSGDAGSEFAKRLAELTMKARGLGDIGQGR